MSVVPSRSLALSLPKPRRASLQRSGSTHTLPTPATPPSLPQPLSMLHNKATPPSAAYKENRHAESPRQPQTPATPKTAHPRPHVRTPRSRPGTPAKSTRAPTLAATPSSTSAPEPAPESPHVDSPLCAAGERVDAWGFVSPLNASAAARAAPPSDIPATAASASSWRVIMRDMGHWLGTRALTRELLRGVPAAVRLSLWERALDVVTLRARQEQRGITYATLQRDAHALDPAVAQQITLDLTRTLHTHALFRRAQPQRVLGSVLRAYAAYSPASRYCQGQSFVAATLLLVTHYAAHPGEHRRLHVDEERVFWLFAALTARFDAYWAPDLAGLQRDTRLFGRVLERALPRVARHLEAQGVDALLFTSKWFLTLLTEGCGAQWGTLLRLWDVLVCEGRRGLLRCALAILAASERELCTLGFEALLPWLLHVPAHALDADALTATMLAHAQDAQLALDDVFDVLLAPVPAAAASQAPQVPPTPRFARPSPSVLGQLVTRAWSVLSPAPVPAKTQVKRRPGKRPREPEEETRDAGEGAERAQTKRRRVQPPPAPPPSSAAERAALAAFTSPTRTRTELAQRAREARRTPSPRALRVLSPASRRRELMLSEEARPAMEVDTDADDFGTQLFTLVRNLF